jgi:flagellar L-ring protein FlgH
MTQINKTKGFQMFFNQHLLLGGALLALFGVACEPAHIDKYTPPEHENRRTWNPEDQAAPEEPEQTPGSIWNSQHVNTNLYADQRAFRVNDVVVVNVSEAADAQRKADTGIDRSSSSSMLFNFAAVIPALADYLLESQTFSSALTADVEGSSQSGTQFRSEGTTGRSEQLTATVPSTVKKVLPNGNLVIEGHRVILVNSEEQHLNVSGIIRPIDVSQDNTVMSTQIADAEIEFVGRGVLTDNQRQGWASRYFGWVWPF